MARFFNKKVHLLDDTYTIKEVLIITSFIVGLIVLLGLSEGMANAIESIK